MSLDAVTNFGKVTVSTGYAAGATSIVLTGGDGAKLPQPSTDGAFNLVWWNSTDYTDPSDDPSVEIVRCTARSTDTLTVTRAQEGTADVNHNTGGKNYKMCLAITKKMITDIDFDLPLDTNLVCYWSFNEGFGLIAVDGSKNGNNGTLNGTMTAADWVSGISGTMLDLDGTDDYISKASPSFIDDTQGAVSLWVRTNSLTVQQALFTISVNGIADDEFIVSFRGDDANFISILLLVNGVVTMQLDSPSNTINDTTALHHIVVTSDGSTIKLFVDNIQQTLVAISGSNTGQWFDDATQADNFTVGALLRASPERLLNGVIDEVRVYSDDLTVKEISGLYKSNKIVPGSFSGFQVGTRTRLSAVAQVIPTATNVRLMFDSEQYDLGNNMDSTTKTGSATSTSANHLVDSAATFVAADVGRRVWNTTDNTYAEITVLNSSTDVTINADIMVNGESYRIYDSQFTVPVTGVYLITAGARLDSMVDAQNTILKINVNGSYVAFGNMIVGAAGAGYVAVSTIYQITAAQKISIEIYHNNGGNQNVENSLLTFINMQLLAK